MDRKTLGGSGTCRENNLEEGAAMRGHRGLLGARGLRVTATSSPSGTGREAGVPPSCPRLRTASPKARSFRGYEMPWIPLKRGASAVKVTETESRVWVPGQSGGNSSLQGERVLQVGGTSHRWLTPLGHALKNG